MYQLISTPSPRRDLKASLLAEKVTVNSVSDKKSRRCVTWRIMVYDKHWDLWERCSCKVMQQLVNAALFLCWNIMTGHFWVFFARKKTNKAPSSQDWMSNWREKVVTAPLLGSCHSSADEVEAVAPAGKWFLCRPRAAKQLQETHGGG